ncbi:MAG: hypothetical protein J5980_04970 [Muribaculaceae bacterium]|nr:hypothetical protein [Muribaculaceae bacterium]
MDILIAFVVSNVLFGIAYLTFVQGRSDREEGKKSWIIWFAIALVCIIGFFYVAGKD